MTSDGKKPDRRQSPFMTVKQFPKRHTWITEAGLRWLIFNREVNGLQESGAIVRMGSKILIDDQKFLAWVRANGGKRQSK